MTNLRLSEDGVSETMRGARKDMSKKTKVLVRPFQLLEYQMVKEGGQI